MVRGSFLLSGSITAVRFVKAKSKDVSERSRVVWEFGAGRNAG